MSDSAKEAQLVSQLPPETAPGPSQGAPHTLQRCWAREGCAGNSGRQADRCGPRTAQPGGAALQASSFSFSPSGEDIGKNLSTATWQSPVRTVGKELRVISNIYNNETKTIIKTMRGAMN